MDLLGSYGSDDSNSDSEASLNDKDDGGGEEQNHPKNSNKKQLTTNTTLPSQATATTSRATAGRISTNTTLLRTKADTKKRVIGKKILKLSAVLPSHILNQLQRGSSTTNDANASDSDDSDSDEDVNDEEGNDKTPHRNNKNPNTNIKKDYSQDVGLMTMLQELSSSKTKSKAEESNKVSSSNTSNTTTTTTQSETTLKTKRIITDVDNDDDDSSNNDDGNDNGKESETKQKSKSNLPTTSSLGEAFITSTVETIIRKRKDPTTAITKNTARNIHDEEQQHNKSPKKKMKETHRAATDTKYKQQKQTKNDEDEEQDRGRIELQQPQRYHRPVVNSTPRATAPRYSMGPPGRAPAASSYDASTTMNYGTSTTTTKKKPLSRKKQMEQLLRAGNIQAVHGACDTQLEGLAHVYTGGEELLADGAAAATTTNNIRVVSTTRYDPKTGTTAHSHDITAGQKQKNQLNSLLSNAAALENERFQNPFYGGRSQTNNSSQKATAKKKYGW